MKILITGTSGFIGSHLAQELAQNYQLTSIDISANPKSYFFLQKLHKKTNFIKANILNFLNLKKIIFKTKPDFIFHLAAKTLVEKSYINPRLTYQTNIIGTVNILEAARKYANIKGVIIASSDKAYGKIITSRSKKKYYESDPLAGDHPYEASKSSADLIAQSYYRTYNLPVVIVRSCNVFGEGDLNFSRIIPGIMKALVLQKELKIRSDGQYVRDYLYIKDLIKGYHLIMKNIEKTKGSAYNFGSNKSYFVEEIISLVQKSLGKKLKYKILNIAKNEIRHQSLDWSRAKKTLGWKPKYNLTHTVRNIYLWYQKFLSGKK